MSHRKRAFLSTGTASIVLIFVLLCLLTFSVLSMVSAKADLNLSTKSAKRTTEYYQAENKANDILADITKSLSSHAGSSSFLSDVRSDLEGKDGITFTSSDRLQYHVTINENQNLFISLQIFSGSADHGSLYQINTWKTENIHDWDNNTSVPVLNSDAADELLAEE